MIPSKLKLAGLAVRAAMVLGAGAALAFGCGFLTSQWRGFLTDIDQRGYDRGVAAMTLQYEQADREINDQLRADAIAREAEIDARRLAAELRATEAEKRASAALMELLENDPEFAACVAAPYPSGVRRHLPARLRVGA